MLNHNTNINPLVTLMVVLISIFPFIYIPLNIVLLRARQKREYKQLQALRQADWEKAEVERRLQKQREEEQFRIEEQRRLEEQKRWN